jgi:hypothetical protein
MCAKDNKKIFLPHRMVQVIEHSLQRDLYTPAFAKAFTGGSLANCITKLQKVIEYNIVFRNFSIILCIPAMISVLSENSANSFTLARQ